MRTATRGQAVDKKDKQRILLIEDDLHISEGIA